MLRGMADPIEMPIKQALRALAGLLAALISAGLVVMVAFGLIFSFDSSSAEGAFVFEIWESAFYVGLTGVGFALPVVLVGTPIFYLTFRHFGWRKSADSAAGGAFLGALVFPVQATLTGDWQDLLSFEILAFGLLGALVGAVGGLGFWWVAVRTMRTTPRHDQRHSNQ